MNDPLHKVQIMYLRLCIFVLLTFEGYISKTLSQTELFMKNFQNFQEFNIMQYFFIDQLGMFGYYVEIGAIFTNMLF